VTGLLGERSRKKQRVGKNASIVSTYSSKSQQAIAAAMGPDLLYRASQEGRTSDVSWRHIISLEAIHDSKSVLQKIVYVNSKPILETS